MRYGSRKFILAMLSLISADALLFFGMLTPTVWGSTVGAILMLYSVSNVAQKFRDAENQPQG